MSHPEKMPRFYRFCWVITHRLFSLFFTWKLVGLENIPARGAVLFASNHVSYLDPPLIGAAIPRTVYFLARKNLFDIPVLGWLMRILHARPVDRDGGGGAGLRTVLDILEHQGGLILFPEGTRSADGELQPMKSGIGLTVLKSEAVVVPVVIRGTFEAWGRHRKFPRRRPVEIRFGVPLTFHQERDELARVGRQQSKQLYQRATERIANAIQELAKDSPGDIPRDSPGAVAREDHST